MIHVWNEIDNAVSSYGDEPISDQVPDIEPVWETQHVIDFPGGIRVIIETDSRAHTAVWLVTE